MAFGFQNKLDFTGVAAAGASAGIGRFLSDKIEGGAAYLKNEKTGLDYQDSNTSMNMTELLSSTALSTVSEAGLRTAFDGGSFGDNFRAALPNAISNVVTAAITNSMKRCFVAGSLIHTPDGLRAFETIKAGDLVRSRHDSFEVDEVRARRIVQTFRTEEQETRLLTVQRPDGSKQNIRTTPGHPFAVHVNELLFGKSNGKVQAIASDVATHNMNTLVWISATSLNPGDLLTACDSSMLRVQRSTRDGYVDAVYNFEVEGDHTYFVGQFETWVHNQSDAETRSAQERARAHRKGEYRQDLQLTDAEYMSPEG